MHLVVAPRFLGGAGVVAGLRCNMPNPHLLIGPFRHREAVLSSRIEGTQAHLVAEIMRVMGEEPPP